MQKRIFITGENGYITGFKSVALKLHALPYAYNKFVVVPFEKGIRRTLEE